MCFPVSLSLILLNSENQDIYLKFFCENNNWFLCPPSHISFFISNIFFRGSSYPKKKHHHNWVVDELLKKRTFIFKKEQKSHVGLVKLHNVSCEKY